MTRKSIRTAATIGTALACLGGLAACSNDSDSNASATNGSNGADEQLTIFATTGYLADAAQHNAKVRCCVVERPAPRSPDG